MRCISPLAGKRMSGVFPVLCSLFTLGACSKSAAPGHSTTSSKYSGTLVNFNSTVVSTATGSITATFNPANNGLAYSFTWQGLSSNPTTMSICDQGVPVLPITGFTASISGSFSGQGTLTGTQVNDLMEGRLYLKIRTTNYPDGEVVGYMDSTSTTATNPGGTPTGGVTYAATLNPTYSAPSGYGYYPPGGSVSANFDSVTMKLSYSVNWSYLTGNPTGMGFQDGGASFYSIPGFAAASGGSVSGVDTLTVQQASDLAAGRISAAVSTSAHPSGEISGALTKQ